MKKTKLTEKLVEALEASGIRIAQGNVVIQISDGRPVCITQETADSMTLWIEQRDGSMRSTEGVTL